MKRHPDTLRPAALALHRQAAAGLALFTAGMPLALLAPPATADGGPQLRLEVSSFRNAKGALSCRLFTDAASFPDGDGARTVRAPIEGAQASCAFPNLPPGTYAVAVVHDENGNGRLDKNLLGVPREGYGVSNNRTYAMSSPKWDESKFTVGAGEPVVLRVNLRY
ncbi:MAG: DUF2141 domain-containing protein [Rubrivivax sp.]|nr:DUF2141 domain-containing protein [Rubrivivax sp.]